MLFITYLFFNFVESCAHIVACCDLRVVRALEAVFASLLQFLESLGSAEGLLLGSQLGPLGGDLLDDSGGNALETRFLAIQLDDLCGNISISGSVRYMCHDAPLFCLFISRWT